MTKKSYEAICAYFYSDATMSKEFRLVALQKLLAAVEKYESKISEALALDLGKSETESYITEIGFIKQEIREYIKKAPKYMKRVKVSSPISIAPAKSYIYPEPKGVVLIIAPWNYPFLLTLSPLIAAISAGNCAIIKPSEFSPHTSEIIYEMITGCFAPEFVAVILGDKAVAENLLTFKFDHIFFTGSTNVGRAVMMKAAESLTPVTLELGGKSPTIVDETADIKLAAKRIVWGKYINAGQTCIAPDYIICRDSIKQQLIDELIFFIKQFYTDDPITCDEYPTIINEKHFDRLAAMLTKQSVVYGGNSDREKLKIAPTIIVDVVATHALMTEEIFGPIIPIITYNDEGKMIDYIRSHPKPLALYLFTKNESLKEKVIKNISFGGGAINDTLVHLINTNLPFGGVGDSGIGAYHGVFGFREFSHFKAVAVRSNLFDLSFRYPPFKHKLKKLKIVIR